MKTKFILLLFFLVILQNCSSDLPNNTNEETAYITGDITSLKVPKDHDLRPLSLQNTSVTLSESSRADMVKIKIFKIENNDYKLLYNGFIDREKSINSIIKIPNHTKLLSVQADLATGTREWIVSPTELQNINIEDEERPDIDASKTANYKGSSAKLAANEPPTWNCDDYQEFTGNDDGDYKISSASTKGININKKTTIYICSGGSWDPAYLNDNKGELTVYVDEGATLKLTGNINSTIYNVGTFNGVNLGMSKDSEFDNWGTTNITGSFNVDSNKINVYTGEVNISGSLNLNSNGHFDNDGGVINIGGHLTTSGKLHNKQYSTLNVAGNLSVNDGDFDNECKTIISGNFINNKQAEFKNASYTVITGAFISNSNIDVKIQEGSILKCASIMSNGKIKGDKAYSVIETGSITFNGNSNFQGSLDICSDSYKDTMGSKDVINTCSSFISPNACSPGFNSVIDNDKDGAIAGVDVDDDNANIATYNYPQGQDSYFTTVFEDLYPCMGDYDLNDLVHNYSYQEGISSDNVITEIKFEYKFPAIGASFNNSFVLRVIDEDNNASLSLESSNRYSLNEITRVHDNQNKTTLFIFNNIKTIYTDNSLAIINTVKIDYADIPILSGTVTNINGAYDEFMLKDGKLGQEVHPLYNKFHRNYPALNLPSMYNDSSNFNKCDDKSTGGENIFINSNGFPWVLNDLPIDFSWPKEGISILKAYPNFDKFVTSDPSLDWYSNINGNRVSTNVTR